jgi:hypothetical protein
MERNQALSLRAGVLGLILLVIMSCAVVGTAQTAHKQLIEGLNNVSTISTTVPANGDLNPYGVVLVPRSKGKLVEGDYLVSNFNNAANQQGTGTTIVQIAEDGKSSVFAQIDPTKVTCPGGVGLTTALVVLRAGFVIVGSLPTTDGTAATAGAGCLIVLDSMGNVVETFVSKDINGPWDMTALDGVFLAVVFVTNVLNGTVAGNGQPVNEGTVARLLLAIPPDGSAPALLDTTVIATGFAERTDPEALVVGPTGVAFDDDNGNLYVADSVNNRIATIPNSLFRVSAEPNGGTTLFQGGALKTPLGLTFTPDRHLLSTNGGDGNLVEIDPKTAQQVATKQVDNTGGPPPGAGTLFGLVTDVGEVYFVNDGTNTLNALR